MTLGEIFIKLGLKSEGFSKGIDNVKKETNMFADGMKKLGGMIAGVFAVGAIKNFISNIINVRSEFEKYSAVLTNTLGSERQARTDMQMLSEIAAKTPFSLSELTASYVKLVNYGLKPTREEIIKLGDLSSSTGKGFDQLTEALADSVTGQYERLKEFGIKASKEGDKVTFTFKSQSTTVENTAESIKKYILSLGELKGVSGSMAAISETLGGRISNLGDAWDRMLNSFGSKSSGIFFSVISWAISLIETIDGATKSVEELKRAAKDESTNSGLQNALKEISDIQSSLMGNGVSEADAHKRAVDLYYDSVRKRMKELYASRKENASNLWESLRDEISAVQSYFAELDSKTKNKTNSTGEYAKKLAKDIADATKALADLPKGSIAYYQAEIALLETKQSLITDPHILEQSKKEIALKKEYLALLTNINYATSYKGGKESVSATPTIKGTIKTDGGVDTKTLSGIGDYLKLNKEKSDKLIEEYNKFSEDLNSVIASGMQSAAETFGEGIGALMSGDMNMEDFGKSMLANVGQFLVSFGKMLIAFAFASDAFHKTLASGGLTWPLALAAGIAMVAIGSAITNSMKSQASGASSSSGTSSSSSSSSSTNTTAANNKVVFEIKGTSLVGVLNNVDRKNNLIR